MFLRCQRRKKDGKVHEYWSIVESRRLGDARVVQRLLESDFALAEKNTLYRCLDKLVEHKDALTSSSCGAGWRIQRNTHSGQMLGPEARRQQLA